MTMNTTTASPRHNETIQSNNFPLEGGESRRSGGGCPVKHSASLSNNTSDTPSSRKPWTSWFRSSPQAASPTTSGNISSSTIDGAGSVTGEGGGCPVKHSASSQLPRQNQLPKSIEEAARHAQTPQAGQTVPLSTVRTVSSILRTTAPNGEPTSAPASTPHHQRTSTDKNWVYPSEQQFFNAMKRKGWDLPPGTELTIPHVVRIHNAVNEKGWSDVVEWEGMRGNHTPRLVRFMGRPDDLSPRAWFMSRVRMKKEPFDRHDWFVDRGEGGAEDGKDCGERRYVIDFYGGEEEEGDATKGFISRLWDGGADKSQVRATPVNKAPSMYLDVRPALDDTEALYDHASMFMKRVFPGIYESLSSSGNSNSSSSSSSNGPTMNGFTSSRIATGMQPNATSPSSSSVGK